MNINNFESYIDAIILDRGYSYYMDGNVVEVFKQSENKYLFHIEGSHDYGVFVEIKDNGDIVYSACDCPYDFGSVCKHEVAAYYQLFALVHQKDANDKVTSANANRLTIQEVLNNLSKEELIDIILDSTRNDTTLEKTIMVKYANGDNQQELQACKRLIDTIVSKYTGREGFIKYRDTSRFVSEWDDLIDKARNRENVLLALDIAFLLLEKAMGAFQYADDSGGDIGDLVSEILELIGELAIKGKKIGSHRAAIFEKLLDQTDNQIFNGWLDFQMELFQICFEFADDELFRESLTTKLKSMLGEKSSDSFHESYRYESLLQLLFQLLKQYGTQEETEQFIHENLQFSSFREELLNQYLQEKEYEKVVEVAKNGEVKDQQYPGLITKWKKFRYTAYKSLSLTQEQQILAKELLFNGDFEYYHDLKALATENKEAFYTNLKEELKSGKGWHASSIFLKVIEEENDLEEILEFVRANPGYVENYAKKLIQRFKEEVIDIYHCHIHSTAKTSSNRRDYQGVCYKLKRYKKVAGKEKELELIHELIGLYKRRPAFIDELQKIE
ncbi:MAG: hypothetical protein ABF649_13900 [Bacillus sp. (in: firmicutes)]